MIAISCGGRHSLCLALPDKEGAAVRPPRPASLANIQDHRTALQDHRPTLQDIRADRGPASDTVESQGLETASPEQPRAAVSQCAALQLWE